VAVYAVLLPAASVPNLASEGLSQNWAAQLDATSEQRPLSTEAAETRRPEGTPAAASGSAAQQPSSGVPRPEVSETLSADFTDTLRVFAAGFPPLMTQEPGRLCEPSAYSAYCIYTVREGDTLGHIAELFELNQGAVPGWEQLVASNKPNLTSADDYILPGQKLRIPTRRGVVHTVILGETVGDLADAFDVTSAAIIAANNLGTGNLLQIGQVLLIPDPQRIPQPQLELPEPEQVPEPEPPPPPAPAPAPEPAQPPPPPAPEVTVRNPVSGFIWPIRATIRITSYFGPRHPLGIDLGLSHDPRAPIYAVEGGTVSFAGGDPCCSYGLYVIVDHGNGYKTLYAHLRRLDVRAGQTVQQGQVLGLAGSTGYSTGPHLHFEVHLNGRRVDPLQYLP
jgi:murein DD-endopeptidase MepM/ murein hydrolase activator NlpD